ncbi:MAG: YqgE/AlgH family protein [Planctomycetota bacterium]|nr:MAG: YqgE/AlgH family protein [Planctomycetota bacterium]
MNSLKGHVLVASPYLVDPNFVQTIVLMIHHTEEGAFGLVVNRRLEKSVSELWQEVSDTPCERHDLLHIGGPVAGPLMALHDNAAYSELEVIPGVYFSAQREHLEQLVAEDRGNCLLFLGHSGWAGGQLEAELATGSWLVAPADPDLVFDESADVWRRVTYQIGREELADILKPRIRPKDPTLN